MYTRHLRHEKLKQYKDKGMQNLSTKPKEKSNQDFWDFSLEKYKISKVIRKLKKHGYTFKYLGEILNVDRHFVYNLMQMNLKPPEGLLKKLEALDDIKR